MAKVPETRATETSGQAPTVDAFEAPKLTLKENLLLEHSKLKVAFDTEHGPKLAEFHSQLAQAQADLARFDQVKNMDLDEWSSNLDFVKSKLEHPESLMHEDLQKYQGWLKALEAKPLAGTPEQLVQVMLLLMTLEALVHPDAPVMERPSVPSGNEPDYETEIRTRLDAAQRGLDASGKNTQVQLLQIQEIKKRLSLIRAEEEHRDIVIDTAQRSKATFGFQERSRRLTETITAMRANSVPPLTPVNENNRKELEVRFRLQLHELEKWDLDMKIASRGGDPYESKTSLPNIPEMVRQFQLARLGVANISDAYKALFKTTADMNLAELGKSVSVERLKELLASARDLARDYPLEAADLGANLAHAYSILNLNGSVTAELQVVLQRRTAENQVIDAVLGQQQALYSAGELKKMTLEQLALIDFCSRAPYIAGVLMQDHMTGAKAAQAAAAWIPGLGAWTPVRMAAGAAGAIAEVKAQKEAARLISRRYEVTANTILRGIQGYQNGGYAGALRDAASYATTRQMLQTSGEIFRTAVEGRSIDTLLQGWRQAPGTEAAKATVAWGAGLAAGASAFGSAVAAAGGTVSVGAILWPAAVVAGVGISARYATSAVHDRFKSAETKLSEKQQQTAGRLKNAYARLMAERPLLPALTDADFSRASLELKPDESIIARATQKLNEQQTATIADVDPNVALAVIDRLALEPTSR